MDAQARIAIVMGSDSDLPIMEGTIEVLRGFGVSFEVHVISAHRSPDRARRFAREAADRGLQVIIAAAGGAAHLAGALAAHTHLPVVGVPIPTDHIGGLDSLFSTVQMPAGLPVATVGIGGSGARNAAYLAVQMLAVGDEALRQAVIEHRRRLPEQVAEKDRKVKQWLKEKPEGRR